jgi:hypothetical protein
MARTTQPTSSDYNYTVVMEDLFTADGKKSGLKCTRRLDTGAVLAPVTKDYGICNNAELFDTVRPCLKDLGDYEEKIYVARGGARVYGRYTFRDQQIKLPQVGDVLGLRLDINNSFDRSCRISAAGGIERLLCLNGMTGTEQDFGFTKKHSSKLNLDFVKNAIAKAVESFKLFQNPDNMYSLMAQRDITQEQGLNILHNFAKKNVISEVHREGIARVWNNPTHEADQARTVYNLLNASTQFLSHEVQENRFELANRVTSKVTRRLLKVTQDPKVFTKFIEEPKEAIVTVTE